MGRRRCRQRASSRRVQPAVKPPAAGTQPLVEGELNSAMRSTEHPPTGLAANRKRIPRLPVLGWQALGGKKAAGTPCLLDHANLKFTTSGRASILLALKMLRIREGDGVLVPSYHCPSMIAPVVAQGARPIFYPIGPSGGPLLDWLQALDTARVKVILAVHYFGLPQPMALLRRWCDTNNVALIEDCAHALFGASGDRPMGSWGDLSVGSLTKFMPVPEGGVLVTNARAAALPLLHRRTVRAQVKSVVDIVDIAVQFHRLAGLNTILRTGLGAVRAVQARMRTSQSHQPLNGTPLDDVHGEINLDLCQQTPTMASRWVAQIVPRQRIVARRRRHFEALVRAFRERVLLRPLVTSLPDQCAPYVFPLWVAHPDPGYAELRRRGIPVFRWDRLWDGARSIPGDVGVEWSHHILQIGCHQDLTDGDLDAMVDGILELFDRV